MRLSFRITPAACSVLFAALLVPGAFSQGSLTIGNTSFLPGSAGQQYAVQLTATGGTPPYTWSATGQLPPGVLLLSSGVITGTPSTSGTFTFTVTVRDSGGATASKQVSITIGGTIASQITISNTTLPSGTVGQVYSQQLSATGGVIPYQWTAGQGLPSFLSLLSSGVLSGTPTSAGTFSFSVQVTDSANRSGAGQIQLTIQPANLSITTVSPLFVGTVGTAYAQPFSASGGTPPYTWSIVSGNPDGLTLDPASGNLAGTPQSAGPFAFTVQVTDSKGATAIGQFSIVVNTPTLSILVGGSLAAGAVGAPYNQKLPLQATGGTPPYTWSITSAPVPGLTFNPSTLVLSGTPTTAGAFSLTVQVADTANATASRNLSLTIAAAGLTITTPRALPDGVLNNSYSQQLSASGGQPPYRWAATGLPAGLTINTSTGLISGTATAAGPFGIAITVSDSALANYSDRFTINITLPQPPAITLSGLPSTVSPAQQYNLQISLATPYPAPITGQAIITFSPDSGPTDRTIQFSGGGTTANFAIATGSTTLNTPLAIQTGSVSGTLTVSLVLQAGGIDITPSPAPSLTAQLPKAAPVIRSVQVTRSNNTVNVIVTGYSTAREVTQAVFKFNAASGQTLQSTASSITVDVTNLFGTWFLDPANSQFGSVFIFTQPFTIQGDPNAVLPVSVTLTNRVGSTTGNISQ